MSDSYRIFLVRRGHTDISSMSTERQIARLSFPEADPYILVSCTVRITHHDHGDLKGIVEVIQKDSSNTISLGDLCWLRPAALEVHLNTFLTSKDLMVFCYPTPLFQTYELSCLLSERDLNLLEESLRVKASTLKELVENINWSRI